MRASNFNSRESKSDLRSQAIAFLVSAILLLVVWTTLFINTFYSELVKQWYLDTNASFQLFMLMSTIVACGYVGVAGFFAGAVDKYKAFKVA